VSERVKLSVYLGERDRAGGRQRCDALLDEFGRRGFAASVLLRGAAGFGAKHHLRSDRLLTLSEDLPVVAVAVDGAARIRAALPAIARLAGDGLVTLERAAAEPAGEVKLSLYARRGTAWREAVAALRRHGVAGATVLGGVDGTLGGERRRARLFGANAGVPVVVLAVGAHAAVARALPELERLLPGAVVTRERVRVCKRDGVRLDDPHTASECGAMWQQLSVYGGGHVLGQQIVLRLRAAGALGATLVRGSWGYHGDHAPHGDRLGALRRDAPLLAVTVDAPERAARSFAVLDALTGAAGLVTSELVPAWRATGGGFEHGALELPPRGPRGAGS
jgi:PII-like signaling protein